MKFKRSIGLFESSLYGIGMIIGAGIYVLIGKVAGMASYGVWLSFLISSIIAIFTGLSYAELSSLFDDDAAEYIYVKKSIKKEYLAHLTAWFMLSSTIISSSVVALGFAGYLAGLLGIPTILLIGIITIVILSIINYLGIELSVKINDLSTLLEIGGLLLIIFGGIVFYSKHPSPSINLFSFDYAGVLNGAMLAFFAFIGFGSIAKISEEVKNPKKTVPLAIIISIIATTILYIAVALVAVLLVSPKMLAASNEPAKLILSQVFPSFSWIISIIALFSTANTLLLLLISSSRLLYGLSKHKVFPSFFGKIHSKFKTPYNAVWFVGVLSILLTLFKKIEVVAEVTNLWIFVTYFFVNLSVIYLRRHKKHYYFKGFKSPLNIKNIPLFAIFGAITSAIMIVYYFLKSSFSIFNPGVYLTLILLVLATLYYNFIRK